MKNYLYGGATDVGYSRENNEDFMNVIELDDTTLFAILCDGAGSKCSSLQPASIAANHICDTIKRIYKSDKELLLSNSPLFLKEAILSANQVLGAFRKGNEEMYAGFGSGVTCCLCTEGGNITFAHTGNSRIYLIRVGVKDKIPQMKQLTRDHTKAQRLWDEGQITAEIYHTHPDRLVITSCLGIQSDPVIQTYSGKLRRDDILLMTTDGIHYAIIPDAIMQLVIAAENCDGAVATLIEAAKMQKYPDNMSAIVLWNRN